MQCFLQQTNYTALCNIFCFFTLNLELKIPSTKSKQFFQLPLDGGVLIFNAKGFTERDRRDSLLSSDVQITACDILLFWLVTNSKTVIESRLIASFCKLEPCEDNNISISLTS